ncbi:helix-turn-helix domain-containing protein [Actinoplanes sp. NPDC051343]|uniref:helix-turn-helix domain-containing protein n=1 Tax=Actinoplanes sp. NPDC051343 TaxID=3363906 RepID=UPI0037872C39
MSGSLAGDTPAVARERLRAGLRRARQKTDLTQTEVAKRLGVSLSKIQRIEIGEVAVSEMDLRALLELYEITAPDAVAAMAADARLARRERYTTDPEYRKNLSANLRRLLQFEVVATQIRSYQSLLLPGVLQTPAMAQYIIDEVGKHLTEDQRRVNFEARMRRRKDVIERADGPEYFLVIDESVIMRNVGGAALMAEQLDDLAEVSSRSNVFVRVLPLSESRGAIIGMLGNFVLMSLSSDDADEVLYRERSRTDDIDHDPDKIRPYRDAFEDLWKLSLSEEATLRLIRAAAATLAYRAVAE